MAKYDNEDGVWRTIGGRRIFIKKGKSLSEAMKESDKFKVANKKNEPVSKYAKLSKAEMEADLEKRKEKIDNGTASDEDKKYYEAGKKTYENYYGKQESKEKNIESTSKEDHTFNMNDEEKKKYEEVGKKMDNLSKDLEEDLKDLKRHHEETNKGMESKGLNLSQKQINEGERLYNKAIENAREEIHGFASSPMSQKWWKEEKGGEDVFFTEISNEYNIDKDDVKKIFKEEDIKYRYRNTIQDLKQNTNLDMQDILEIIEKIEKKNKK